MKQVKKFRGYYIWLLVLVGIYITVIALVPSDSAGATRYNLSPSTAKLLSLSLAIPVMIIWYAAFYGFIKVKQYAYLAGATKDGRALRIIGNGLMVLAFSIPITSITGNIRNYLVNQNPDLRTTAVIVQNYLALALALVSLWLIAHGAKQLVKTLKKKPYSAYEAVIAVIFTSFCFVYTYITLSGNFDANGSVAGVEAYHLPDFLVFSTIVVPYIVLWFLGLRAAYHMQIYRAHVPGILYRQALGYLAAGVASVSITLMTLRVLVSLSSFLNSLSLRYLLVLLYALILMIGISFGLIAFGAKKLKKIEEV